MPRKADVEAIYDNAPKILERDDRVTAACVFCGSNALAGAVLKAFEVAPSVSRATLAMSLASLAGIAINAIRGPRPELDPLVDEGFADYSLIQPK